MHANETQARAYITEVTGLTLGRVVSNFPHRIEFQCAQLTYEGLVEIRQRVENRFPNLVTRAAVNVPGYKLTIGYGRVLFLSEHSVGLMQVCEPSDNLRSAMGATYQAVAEDGCGIGSNAEAIEIVLDADRMTMYGRDGEGKRADEEVDALTAMFGYDKVMKELNRLVRLY
jgi:hypothetical protein